MDRQKLKDLINEEAKRVLEEAGALRIEEEITPDQIKKLAEECKKINSSLDFRSPIINKDTLLAESVTKPNNLKANMKIKQSEQNRWKRLVEYRSFSDDTLNEGIEHNGMPANPADFFDYVVQNGGINVSLEEGMMDKIGKASFPYILAGYLSIFGGNISDAVAQFEKDTNTKATTELVQQGKEIAQEKGVSVDGGTATQTPDDPSKGKPSPKIKYTETSKAEEVHHYDKNGYPIYQKGTPSHTAWKSSFELAKGTFDDWKGGLEAQGVDFKTQNPTEVDPHLRYKEINGRLYLVFHYGEVNPDGSPIADTNIGNNLDYYLDLGPAPEKKADLGVTNNKISSDTLNTVKPDSSMSSMKSVDSLNTKDNTGAEQEVGIKGVKKRFSMNVGVKVHTSRDAAGNKVNHSTGDIVKGEKVTFPDGVSIMMDEKGTYYDISNPQEVKKIDPADAEYGKYDLTGKNKLNPSDKRVIKGHIKALRRAQ